MTLLSGSDGPANTELTDVAPVAEKQSFGIAFMLSCVVLHCYMYLQCVCVFSRQALSPRLSFLVCGRYGCLLGGDNKWARVGYCSGHERDNV